MQTHSTSDRPVPARGTCWCSPTDRSYLRLQTAPWKSRPEPLGRSHWAGNQDLSPPLRLAHLEEKKRRRNEAQGIKSPCCQRTCLEGIILRYTGNTLPTPICKRIFICPCLSRCPRASDSVVNHLSRFSSLHLKLCSFFSFTLFRAYFSSSLTYLLFNLKHRYWPVLSSFLMRR